MMKNIAKHAIKNTLEPVKDAIKKMKLLLILSIIKYIVKNAQNIGKLMQNKKIYSFKG